MQTAKFLNRLHRGAVRNFKASSLGLSRFWDWGFGAHTAIVQSRPSVWPGKCSFLPNERSNRIRRNAQFKGKRPESALQLLLEGIVAVCDHEHPAFVGVLSGNVSDIRQISRRRENPSATLDQLRVVRKSVVISAVDELF